MAIRRIYRPYELKLLVASAFIFAVLFGVFLLGRSNLAQLNKESLGPAGARIEATVTPPRVEVQQLRPVSPQDARAINSRRPFSPDELKTAAPFRYAGPSEARARAVDCLAAAAWYEAGDDSGGEKAVIQVVLNRVRHLAFPASVCGVVFQGSDRRTGCQFTFTCDGSLARFPSQLSWKRAQLLAQQALDGAVDASVGQATHYHADYVVPYWSSSLDKIARVGAHIFYRWHGYWGDTAAFRRKLIDGAEPPAVKLALLSPAHHLADSPASAIIDASRSGELKEVTPVPAAIQLPGVREKSLRGAQVRGQTDNRFFIQLQPETYPGNYATAALAICAKRSQCTVYGWRDERDMAFALPLTSGSDRALTFYYRRDENGSERALWNCDQVQRANRAQCLPSEAAGVNGLNR